MERIHLIGWLVVAAAAAIGSSERRPHQVQHGPCSYTFLLPEVEHCHPSPDYQVTNSLQRDSPSPPAVEQSWQAKKLETLESVMENNTQWLQKLESYIQENVRTEMEELQRDTVQKQTAAMLEIGTNLLSQSAEQTRQLTHVETQVLNQTTRLEIQLLEYSLSTSKLEKQILHQTQEITRLNDKNSFLEQRFVAMEGQHTQELQMLRTEKLQLQELLMRQGRLVSRLESELGRATRNSTQLQHQQATLTDTVQQLLALVSQCNEISIAPKEEVLTFKDCAEIYKSGITESGVYTLHYPNSTQTVKVLCDMQTQGGGWTVLQHRRDGKVDFHRSWQDYKSGFGEALGEYWVGNEFIHQLTSSQEYSLLIQLRDTEGSEAHSQYEHFYIDSEEKNYSLHTRGFHGTAGKTSSLTHSGTQFSTKDRDNDKCSCKCAQMASGGWWFEACGPSNLNGIYYAGSTSVVRYNGIKWYYWKGPSMIATMTNMMVRPLDF